MCKYVKCSICGDSFHTQSGKMKRHLLTAHGIDNIQTYFYMSNNSDKCIVCHNNEKYIKNWSFDKLNTCKDHKCVREHANNLLQSHHKQLASEGKHNFQSPMARLNAKNRMLNAVADGTHISQNKDNLDRLSLKFKLINEINNPMKNPDIAKKMSISSTGKVLSSSHRENISISMCKFMNSLSDEEFIERMSRTVAVNIDRDEKIYKDVDLMHIFDNIEDYIHRTNTIIAEMEFNVLNKEKLMNMILE